jgi:hypothetical protein
VDELFYLVESSTIAYKYIVAKWPPGAMVLAIVGKKKLFLGNSSLQELRTLTNFVAHSK